MWTDQNRGRYNRDTYATQVIRPMKNGICCAR